VRAGERIADRFLLEERAGTGGMGVVWRARDEATSETVALKLLLAPEVSAERFAREAEVLATLAHPNVVRHVAHGIADEGRLYLAMEWLEGEHLGQSIARGPMSIEDAIDVASGVAGGLSVAHARGIVHRDLKPPNVFLVGKDPANVRVLDFGIARVLDATHALTQTGFWVGTPGYMAPEQARAERTVDARADVFALGCVLFECLAGKQAFAGEHALAILAKLLLADPPRLMTLRPEVPSALDDLVQRMLAKEPERRPADGRALGEELSRIALARGRVSQRPDPSALALTPAERRIASVIVAGVANPVSADTLPAGETEAHRRSLERIARTHDVRIEALGDGTTLLLVEGGGEATDRVARAARIALAVREAVSGVPVALATGWTDGRSREPIGEVIDLAVSLLARAAADGAEDRIAIDSVSCSLLRGRFTIEEREGVAYLASDDRAGGLDEALPFIGRDRVLARILDLADECFEERFARALVLSGEPGVGKSRLANEVLRALERRGTPPAVWRARADAARRAVPHGVLGELLRSAWGIERGGAEARARSKMMAALASPLSPEELARHAPILAEVAGLAGQEDADELADALRDGRAFARRVGEAMAGLCRAVCDERPLVVLIEDVHWGDVPTLRALEAPIRGEAAIPLLVMAVGRPESREILPFVATDWDLAIQRIRRLVPEASRELVRRVLGPGADEATIDRIVALGEGHPQHLEELLRAARAGELGAPEALPASLAAVLAARFERFSPEARTVLRTASVFGEAFHASGVERLLGGAMSKDRVRASLAELVEAEMLDVTRSGDGTTHRFRHELARGAAYASSTPDNRRAAHQLAAAWLRETGDAALAEVAAHLELAGDRAAAATTWLAAAERAVAAEDARLAAHAALRSLAAGAEGETKSRAQLIAARSRGIEL
jgi:hypothetical protein